MVIKGGFEGFVTKFSPAGSPLTYSTLLAGSGDDTPQGIAVDASGSAYITGTTNSSDFPLSNAIQAKGGGGLFKTTNGGTSWTVSNTGLTYLNNAIAVDPTNPNRVYSANGFGVSRSTDGGNTWTPTTFNTFSAFSIVLDPNNPSVIYAGSVNGVGKSTDAGNTWTTNAAGFVNAGIVETTAIDPTNSSILYAGTSNGGVLKSMDGGINWTPMNSGITNLFILSLAVDRMNPATLFVGNSAGVLKSTNGGVSWINSSTGLPTGSGRSVTGFAFDPTTSSTIFATTAAIGSTQAGVFKSTNGGGSWTSLLRTDFSLGSIVIDSNNSSTLYVASNANTNTGLTSASSGVGILKSPNGGATWTPSGLTQDFIQGLTFDPTNPSTIYAPATGGNDAFVSVLNNAGSSLGFSSYLGGTGAEVGNAIALDSTPNVYVAGATASMDFPQRNPPTPSTEHDTIPLRQPDDDFLVALKLAFGCPDLSLTPTLPDGSEGSFYNQAVTVSGGLPGAGYTFSVGGDLPPGLKITSNISSSAVIFGEPTTPGTYTFAIIATDTNGCMVNRVYTITIATRPPLLGQNDASNGDPISTATGEVFDFFDFDLYVRGPMALRFSRYYSSASSTTGLVNSSLGNNWMHNYDLRLDLNGTSATVVYELGQPVVFKLSGGTWNLSTTDSLIYQLVQSGSSFRFFDPSSNIIYTFNTSAGGRLERIEDRYGSVLTLTYIGSLLSRVADGLGRTIDFTYSSGHLASVQDQSGRIVLFSYSGNNLTGATDAAGKTTLYSYTAVGSRVGLLVSSTRPRGNTPYTQAFDSNARVSSQTDAAGNITSFAYNVPSPGSTTLTDPLAHTRLFRHQGGRNMVEQKDEAGNSVLLSYDGQNRKTSVTDRNGNTTTYNYHSGSGLLASITYPNASTLTCTYIATTVNGFTFYDLTRAVYPDGADERFTYDANGNVASKTDRTGQTWQFNYNSRGQVLTASIPTGGVVALTYNSDGTLASYQPPNAGPVTYTYDSVKRPITRRQANGSTRSWTWDARGRIVSFTNERGATVTATYDNNSQLATLTDPAGGRIAFTYTGTEHVAQVTDQMGQIVTLSYDALDRLMSATYPDGAVIRYAYDVTGFLSSITDGEGKVWQINHDHEGRETSFITPLGNRTDFARSPLGQISGATTPLGNQFGLTHDAFGRLATVVDPLSNTTRFNYDARGDISAFTLANGIVASYTRNSLQKITQVTDPRGNKWNYSFDAAGRLLSATDPLGNTMTYTRDVRGRISQVALPGGGSVATTTDGSGRLTRSGFSDGTTLDYTYDSRALLTSATGITLQRDARGDITSSNGVEIERDSLGRISKVTFAAGKAVTYSYDRRDLLTKVQDFVGGVTTFTYDDDSRLVMIARPNGTATTYSYDAEGNADSINESSGGNSLASTLLVRDKDGQVTQATRNVPLNPTGQQLLPLNGSRSFDAASQVAAFSYDSLGRRTSDNRRSYSWNLASRLQSYTAGVETAQFTYDALRQMLSQTSGGVTRQFVWNYAFALPSISVIKQGGSDLRYYVHTPDGELLYSIEASDNSRRFFHFDEMGNTLFLTNDAAAVTDSYAYAPYGTLLASAGTTDNPFSFEGRYGVMRIGVSGLYYIRQRFYDSLNASFISRDSLARIEPGMINPYQYAADNPLVFFDATGGEPSSAGSTAGTTAVDVIGNAGGAAGIVGAGLGSKAQAINNLVDAIGDGVPAVGGLVGKSDSVLANVNYLTKLTTKGEKLSKLAKPFKKLGNLGTAAQVFEVGLNGYNHYTADQKVMQEAEDERTRILWNYGVQANNILELFREKKIGEVQRNRLLLQAQFDMEEALLVAGFEEDFGIFFNMTVAFKNGAETFVPVPLSSIPNPFENKPLIDFGAGEFLVK